ncbi:MAG: class I SAM-dependent methyltransferase [Eubacterium sp.]|nr:class I SAM-dependent methyltransferase [Eubacterium sp.]
MLFTDSIIKENKTYWTRRADGYSKVNQEELSTAQKNTWRNCLVHEIRSHFPDRQISDIHILDVGTGPGFFSILLAEAGFRMTAVDLTPAMLNEARHNAGTLADHICFMEMNAEHLTFDDQSFDVVISRNLTWNLPNPERAYAEWTRVLKPNGLLLNFDANWYHYLFDEKARDAYDADRINTQNAGMKDGNVGENFDVMEDIASRIPLSKINRPFWDLQCLNTCGMSVDADEKIWQRVWSEEERMNFSSTPLFMIRAKKLAVSA